MTTKSKKTTTSTAMDTYLVDSGRTAAAVFHDDTIRQVDYEQIIDTAVGFLKRLDQVKKALFYRKEPSWGYAFATTGKTDPRLDKDLVHAILGIATEAGELLELLLDPKKVTPEKLKDESGDVLWYLALLFRTIDTNFDEVAGKNIEKLKVRFPDKFTEALAIHRDDASENAVF